MRDTTGDNRDGGAEPTEPTQAGAQASAEEGGLREIRRPISRRFLIQMAAAAGLTGATAAGVIVESNFATASAAMPEAKHQWAFMVDLRKCDGCEKCTQACQKAHYLGKDQTWIKVYTMNQPDGEQYFMPRLCMHCENPPCQRVCPVGATFKNAEGVVLVDQTKCIGCRACMAACPYEARYFNWTQPPAAPTLNEQPMPEYPVPQLKGTVGKCILCVHNTDVGKLPACVDGCTMGALYIADMKTDIAINGLGETVKFSQFLRDNDAVRYREELGTQPRVYYILGHGQDLSY